MHEFFEFFRMDYTNNVFVHESNYKGEDSNRELLGKISDINIKKAQKLQINSGEEAQPLLMSIITMLLSGRMSEAGSVPQPKQDQETKAIDQQNEVLSIEPQTDIKDSPQKDESVNSAQRHLENVVQNATTAIANYEDVADQVNQIQDQQEDNVEIEKPDIEDNSNQNLAQAIAQKQLDKLDELKREKNAQDQLVANENKITIENDQNMAASSNSKEEMYGHDQYDHYEKHVEYEGHTKDGDVVQYEQDVEYDEAEKYQQHMQMLNEQQQQMQLEDGQAREDFDDDFQDDFDDMDQIEEDIDMQDQMHHMQRNDGDEQQVSNFF